MIAGAVLAVLAAIALNACFLLQHLGSADAIAVDVRRPVATVASLLRSRVWLLGGVLGILGWALHIAAMHEAPLSLVQAFVAGGLALAVPMSAVVLKRRLDPAELRAIALMVAALVLLALGLRDPGAHAHIDTAALVGCFLVLAGAAAALAGRGGAAALGIAGGLLYGAADLGLKAVTSTSIASPWLPIALLATAGAFFAFQRGLQSDRPLAVIALMTAATNVGSITGAFVVFGDPLGRTPALAVVHLLAFVLVIVAAYMLAPAQARLAGEPKRDADVRSRRTGEAVA